MSFGMVAASYLTVIPGGWQNRTVLTGSSVDPNGTNSHTCTFTPASSGNFLVAIVAGSVTSTTPAGWTLAVSAINYCGLYVFTKTASAGENSFATTHNASNYAVRGIVYEFPAGTTVLGRNFETGVGGGDITGPSVAGLTGTYAIVAARCHVLTTPAGAMNATWTTPAVEDYEEFVGDTGTAGVGLSVAYQSSVTGGSFACAYNMTWDGTGSDTGEVVALALSN